MDTEWNNWRVVCLGHSTDYYGMLCYKRSRDMLTQIARLFYESRQGLDMTVTINSEDQKRQFARDSMEWLDSIPDDRHEWCDALIAGAIDECRGDLLRALDMAKAQYIETPEPPDEPYPTADNHTAESTIPQGFAGHGTYPGPVQPLPDNDPNEVPFKADKKNEQVDNG